MNPHNIEVSPSPLEHDRAEFANNIFDEQHDPERTELRSFNPSPRHGGKAESVVGVAPLNYTPKGRWMPYEDSHNEMPLWRWLCSCYYRCRYPLLRLARFSIIRIYKFEITIGGLLLFAIFFALFGFHTGYTYKKDMDNVSISKAIEHTGVATSVSLLALFSIAGRNSIWAVLLGIPYERICVWHKILTMAVIGQGGFHAWVVYNNSMDYKEEVVTGWILYGLICGMFVFTMPVIWLGFYRTFWIFHRLVVIGIIILVGLHGAFLAYIGIGLWALDVILRHLWLLVNRSKVKTAMASVVAGNMIELRFPKNNFDYAGGQYVFMTLPDVSFWEPHPFSFSSAPYQKDVTFHIKALGDWTHELLTLAATPKEVSIYMDGPYGAPALDFENPGKRFFLFVAGGIGITPNLSAANTLLDQVIRGRHITKMIFVWAIRNIAEISAVISPDDLLFRYKYDIHNLSKLAGRQLDPNMVEIEIFLTSNDQVAAELSPNAKLYRDNVKNNQKLNIDELFSRVEQTRNAVGNPKGNVLCCGPSGMLTDVSWQAKKYGYSHHIEMFEY